MKRALDVVVAGALLCVLSLPYIALIPLIRRSTGGSAIFRQHRVGRSGELFEVRKLRTMRVGVVTETTATTASDPRITPLGRWLRRTKVDELPQLLNVWEGSMTFVGPRPDVPGYADRLTGVHRSILRVRPGMTGPASLAFRDEEAILDRCGDAARFNDEVLWPLKVEINAAFVHRGTPRDTIAIILGTLGLSGDPIPAMFERWGIERDKREAIEALR